MLRRSSTLSIISLALAVVAPSGNAQESSSATIATPQSTVRSLEPAGSKDQGQLVWKDEFDGAALDYSKWNVEVNAFGGGNGELQIYTDRSENVRVEDGYLVLEARRDNTGISGTVREYSSGRVRTKHRGDWLYGRIDVRAKLPSGTGVWPAIWMLPTEDRYGGWAASGEIDIMEMKGQEPDTVLGTLHYGGQWPNNKYSGDSFKLPEGTFSDDFHVFSVDWREGKIEWSIDGKLVQTQTQWSSVNGEFPAPFDQEFHLLLNLAVGGGFLGPPNETTKFPCRMLIDYVRVYQ
jgi:beta-glucanase (GH16 family)